MTTPFTSPIRWRVHLASPPDRVVSFLSEPTLIARFWSESAVPDGDGIQLVFPDLSRLRVEIHVDARRRHLTFNYFGGSRVEVRCESDGSSGTDVQLSEVGIPEGDWLANYSGWVGILLGLKAAVDFGIDLRNHDSSRTWAQGYVDN